MSESSRASAETELLAALRAGREGAWAELWRTHHPWLSAFAAARVRDPQEGEDLASEALTRTLVRLRSGPPPQSLRAYLRATVLNLTADVVARRERDRRLLQRLAQQRPEQEAEGGEPELLAREERERATADARAALAALDTLTGRQRHVLVRLVLDGVPLPEVAAELGLTANATSQLAFRARRNLREAWAVRRGPGRRHLG